MRRTYIALILAPLLVSGIFGIFALVAFPFMLLMTCVVALPLLLWFKRIERMNWWIAVTRSDQRSGIRSAGYAGLANLRCHPGR